MVEEMKFILLLIIIIMVISSFSENNKQNSTNPKRRKSFAAQVFTGNTTFLNSTQGKKELCRWLRGSKHQSQLCVRRRGLAAILLEAKSLAVSSCTDEFQYEQWNCRNVNKFFKKMYRETAFMTSLASSALLYSIAKACAKGRLPHCRCASQERPPNETNWQWGGCGDNTKYARKLTKNFLQLKKDGDTVSNIAKSNSKIGMAVVLKSERIACACHGVSQSCTLKICWKRIAPFKEITKALKHHYHHAIQVESANTKPVHNSSFHPRNLLYLDDSPDFCENTAGRRCKNKEICATLCCSENYDTFSRNVLVRCNCHMSSMVDVFCDICTVNQTVYICK